MEEKTPEEIKESILKQLNSPIVEALDNEGITPSYLAKLLHKELSAKQIKCFQHQGEIVTTEIPALDIMQKARQDAHKLLDHYPAERHKIEQLAPITIILDVPDEVEGELEADET